MKFITLSTIKDTFFTMPPVMVRQIAEANVAFMKQQRQAGKVLEAYIIPGWRRSVVKASSTGTNSLPTCKSYSCDGSQLRGNEQGAELYWRFGRYL